LKELAAQQSCCGGPAISPADACCSEDEIAKAEGKDGCGCGPTADVQPAKASACCEPA